MADRLWRHVAIPFDLSLQFPYPETVYRKYLTSHSEHSENAWLIITTTVKTQICIHSYQMNLFASLHASCVLMLIYFVYKSNFMELSPS
jgi:hypothetical protein